MSNTKGSSMDDVLSLFVSLVASHGDTFRFSVSKAGRVWLTLTHWDGDKYSTSAELPFTPTLQEFWHGLAMVSAGHYVKCFGSSSHSDSWSGSDAVSDTGSDAVLLCSDYVRRVAGKEGNQATATSTETDKREEAD